MQSELVSLNTIVDDVISSEVSLDVGIDTISSILYDKAFALFGKTKRICKGQRVKSKHQNSKSDWFNDECKVTRREFRHACKLYRRNRSVYNCEYHKAKRRKYNQAKRSAKCKYNMKQRANFEYIAKHQPQKFWKEIKKDE